MMFIMVTTIKIKSIATNITEHLCGRYCFMCFTHMDLFNPHCDPLKKVQ